MSSSSCFLLVAVIAGLATTLFPDSACAKPEYARKEGVACQYCHVSGSPGSLDQLTGKREAITSNARGVYYQTHNHSFQGYVEPAATAKVASPNFHFVWAAEMKTMPRRMAVADVTGDGKLRLITLDEKAEDKNSAILEVRRWDGKQFVTEFTGDVHAPPDMLAVGRVGGTDKPAVILTSDALWAWDGSTYARRPATSPLPLLGITRMRDGTERVLLAPSAKNVLAYRVNLRSVKKDEWLIDPIAAPSAPGAIWGDMHATPEMLTAMGIPNFLCAGGLVGIWKIDKFNAYFIYDIKVDRDFDVAPDPQHPGKPKITYKNILYSVSFRDTQGGAELWTSPKLPGEGYDIALEDPKGGGKQGFLVLFNGTLPSSGAAKADPKGRTLAYFAMD